MRKEDTTHSQATTQESGDSKAGAEPRFLPKGGARV